MRRSRFSFNGITGRVINVTLLIFVSWTIAGAYTIVFRGGKRVEIPSNFIVTSNAVIYETAPGVTISIRLDSIDVSGTEQVNNESSGSLLHRIGAERFQVATSNNENTKAARTITNKDLEPYERARMKSEADWEKRRTELGLPSLEEIRREAARRDAALDEFIAKQKLEAENTYLREREAELRAAAAVQTYTNNYQGEQSYWSNGILLNDNVFGRFDSRFRFGRGFPSRLNQGSPCGFNPSPSCLLTHPFSLFNQRGFTGRGQIFVSPRVSGGRGRSAGVFVSPGRRH